MPDELPNPTASGPAAAKLKPSRWRTVVLPLLRLGVLAIIAIALVKVAFFPSNAPAEAEELFPEGELHDPVVAVEPGDIVNDVELEGTVVRDQSQPVLATVQGEIGTLFVAEGDAVERGDRIYQIRTQHMPDPVEPTEDDPNPPQPGVYYTYADVAAPASGTLTDFPFLVGMPVDIGTETGQIRPESFHVEASITAAQQYRFSEAPQTATITIDDGPAPFACEDVAIVQAEGGDEQSAGASVQCPIPADVRVFPALAVTVTVAGGSALGVPVLPTTAVIGTADTGVAFVQGDDGEPKEVEIGLGINDGKFVEITSGLALGDEVLLYAPGIEDDIDCDDPEQFDPLFCGEQWP